MPPTLPHVASHHYSKGEKLIFNFLGFSRVFGRLRMTTRVDIDRSQSALFLAQRLNARRVGMKTAIIGLGNIGKQVALNLIVGGQYLIVADRGSTKAQEFAKGSGGKARAASVPAAIEEADIVIFAVMFDAIKELLAEHRNRLAGKIVVDPSNPIAPDGSGGFKKIIPQDQSSGQILAALLPPGAKFVKAFGTLAAGSLKTGARRSPELNVLFYASDDRDAGNAVADLIRTSGFAPVRVGGINQSNRIEVFGDLHELGKLGKLVTAKEAAALM
jgi:predicted dinucleotide-binding enzyme